MLCVLELGCCSDVALTTSLQEDKSSIDSDPQPCP